MKKQFLLIVFLFTSIYLTTAQESYTVKMVMKIEGMPPEYAGFGEQELVNYLKGDKYKNEMTSMMGSSTTTYDGKLLTSITDQMGNKTGYTVTQTELDSMKKKNAAEPKPKIEYTVEKKTIAGFECTKAIITSTGKDGKPQLVTVWVTDKIKSVAARGKRSGGRGMQLDFGDLNGYPLQIEMSMVQGDTEMKMVMTAVDVSTSAISDSVFTVNTEGYTMMSYSEMLEKMKAARKGGY